MLSAVHCWTIFHSTSHATDAPNALMNITLSAVSVNSVLLSWKPPPANNTSCPPATYIIKITAFSLSLDVVVKSVMYTIPNNMVHGLTQGQEYSFTVVGVDAGGRVGENSAPSTITMDSSLFV